TFVIHWCMLHVFQRSIEKFRSRLGWIYRTYFSEDERVGLDLQLEPRSYWYQPELYIGLIAVSFVGTVLTAIYLWLVRYFLIFASRPGLDAARTRRGENWRARRDSNPRPPDSKSGLDVLSGI